MAFTRGEKGAPLETLEAAGRFSRCSDSRDEFCAETESASAGQVVFTNWNAILRLLDDHYSGATERNGGVELIW